MSLNTAHANNGVLLHQGEIILLFSDKVTVEFFGQDDPIFRGVKQGRMYLTTHRMIFNNKNNSEAMKSFSFPFITLNDVDIEQPVFGANYIRGKVRAQPNGNWTGEAKFKLIFKGGGAIEFGTAMLHAARLAQRNMHSDVPPPYTPPSGSWYEAPPPAYQPPPGYYGWLPQTEAFANGPPPNTVFMSNNPPPYPGISVPQNGPPQPGYPGAGYQAGYAGGFQSPHGGYPSGPAPGYPGASGYQGYPGAPPPGSNYSYPPQNGYPGGAASAPATNMGFTAGPPQNSKEAEAAQSAYYDPNAPQTAYVPPPAYYEPPPSYNSIADKKTQ